MSSIKICPKCGAEFSFVCPNCGADNQAKLQGIKENGGMNPEWIGTNQAVVALLEQGRSDLAIAAAEKALQIAEDTFGSNHKNVAKSLSVLGLIYSEQDKLAEAENYWKRSLAIYDQTIGLHHPDTAQTQYHLGMIYHLWGNYIEAEKLYIRVLVIWERILVPNHPDFVDVLEKQVDLYRKMGRVDELKQVEMLLSDIQTYNRNR